MKWYQTSMARLEQGLYIGASIAGWAFLYLGMLLPLWIPTLDTTRLMLDGAVLLLLCQMRLVRRLNRQRDAVVNTLSTFVVMSGGASPDVRAFDAMVRKAGARGTSCS